MGRITKSEKNPNALEEGLPAYVQGIDNVTIVKVACGANITLALSDEGKLFATGTFKVCRQIISLLKLLCLCL